jgi:thioredoxin reductase
MLRATLATTSSNAYDSIIIGGGPAGLSAALVLGRCRRRVLIFDAGHPRNARSSALHGFLTRDGTPPLELLAIARSQLVSYTNVELRQAEVVQAACQNGTFEVRLKTGEPFNSRTLVLATGVTDELPQLPGLDECYGVSVFHCPYCDGWEWRDRRLAVLGCRKSAAGLVSTLFNWSRDLVLCTNGPDELSPDQADALGQLGVPIKTDRIARLEGDAGFLKRIHFVGGAVHECDAIFVTTRQHQASSLPSQLGCEDYTRRTVPTGEHQKAEIPGLYVIGDASRDVQMVIVAAAEGADAAFSINKYLLSQELPAALRE